jgi:predicted phosphoribosyltransferase
MQVSERAIELVIAREREELTRRERLYRGEQPVPALTGRTVIIVDDGLATGSTMYAAVLAVRTLRPARIIVAAPVASPEAQAVLREVADACVCAYVPGRLYSVGQWYEDFSPTTDGEVLNLLRRSAQRSRARPATSAAAGA